MNWEQLLNTDRESEAHKVADIRNPLTQRDLPTSTTFSSLKRLVKNGYVIKTDTYEIEDPFFLRWINKTTA